MYYNTRFVMPLNCEMQGCQWYEGIRIKTYFRENGEFGSVVKGWGHFFISSNSSHFPSKTDFEQCLFKNKALNVLNLILLKLSAGSWLLEPALRGGVLEDVLGLEDVLEDLI